MTDDSAPKDPGITDSELRSIMLQAMAQVSSNKDSAIGWLAAAIATFNAAGLATSLSFSDKLEYPLFVSASFSAALLLTFATGIGYVFALSETENDIAKMSQWSNTSDEGRVLVGATDKYSSWDGAYKALTPALLLGISATISTIVAVVAFGVTIRLADPAKDRLCLAIQKDMLSARRRILDGPDVFQALDCRPDGSGVVWVKPTVRELRAGRALPDGGYPNRK
ncbi:hypothetical protein [Sphingomonas sp. Leaf226]|nr:hypothetical protein [Sphingomonas sp. Leaf226]MDY0966954.1 hypothetical protein [Sphingomonas sp. CFBP9021]